MVNISTLLDAGGNIRIEVSPDDLAMFAESIIERHEVSRRREREESLAAESETLLTTKEAKEMLGVCDCTLNTWRKRGYLVPRKVGRRNLYALSDIRRILYGERKTETVAAYCRCKEREGVQQ